MPMRVEVEHDGRTQWCPAVVSSVDANGSIEASIHDAIESWTDTFAWHEEGRDWKRDLPDDAVSCPLPPAAWEWPDVGAPLEVEVEHEGVTRWWPAVVMTVLATGAFEVRITDDVASWNDWLTWPVEDKDWRRVGTAVAAGLSAESPEALPDGTLEAGRPLSPS